MQAGFAASAVRFHLLAPIFAARAAGPFSGLIPRTPE